jgi:uncharacterized membrane protein
VTKNRLEAFSDGVIAIIITIMVLEMHAPVETTFAALIPILPIFLGYILSFIFIGIYWSNHHHLLHVVQKVNGPILWANTHLLFWLSLIPFTTAWMGEHVLAPAPTALYGLNLLFCAIAYSILVQTLLYHHGRDSKLSLAIGNNFKGWASLVIYITAVAVSLWLPILSYALYVLVAIMWLLPSRKIEKLSEIESSKH